MTLYYRSDAPSAVSPDGTSHVHFVRSHETEILRKVLLLCHTKCISYGINVVGIVALVRPGFAQIQVDLHPAL